MNTKTARLPPIWAKAKRGIGISIQLFTRNKLNGKLLNFEFFLIFDRYQGVGDKVRLEKELLFMRDNRDPGGFGGPRGDSLGASGILGSGSNFVGGAKNKMSDAGSGGGGGITPLLDSDRTSGTLDHQIVEITNGPGGNEGRNEGGTDFYQELKDAQNIFEQLHSIFNTKDQRAECFEE
jgi:hypothetical protein